MFTEIDEGKGLVKTNWNTIRSRVVKVEPIFAALIDEINPDKNFVLYLAYYPFGSLKGDTISTLFPGMTENFFRLTDRNVNKEIIKNLGYSQNNSPMGMVLSKNFELFIDLDKEKITIPWQIYQPGDLFPYSKILRNNERKYSPNGILSTAAGSRSVFMLPNIGCITNHVKLQREYNVKTSAPKTLYDHYAIFKEIYANKNSPHHDWHACVLYFSEPWLKNIAENKAWQNLKIYLHERAWKEFDFRRNNIYYNMTFSIIQQKRNLNPNPYLVDTAKHLFSTALGAAPGYSPSINDESLPLYTIQKAFLEAYGLKKYKPTIMQPQIYNFEVDKFPIYYSLQNPSTHVFSPKSRQVSSTLFEMRELEHILNVFTEELVKENSMCSNTILSKISKKIKFKYYHNKLDQHKIIKPAAKIEFEDLRFKQFHSKLNVSNLSFAADASFVRGCISIK